MLWRIDHQSRVPLQDQIAGCVQRAVSEGALAEGERVPPTAELAEALGVDRNTVLAAYRRLRDDGVLEFRRGRGARVCGGGSGRAALDQAARALVEVAREHGYGRAEMIRLIKEMT